MMTQSIFRVLTAGVLLALTANAQTVHAPKSNRPPRHQAPPVDEATRAAHIANFNAASAAAAAAAADGDKADAASNERRAATEAYMAEANNRANKLGWAAYSHAVALNKDIEAAQKSARTHSTSPDKQVREKKSNSDVSIEGGGSKP